MGDKTPLDAIGPVPEDMAERIEYLTWAPLTKEVALELLAALNRARAFREGVKTWAKAEGPCLDAAPGAFLCDYPDGECRYCTLARSAGVQDG